MAEHDSLSWWFDHTQQMFELVKKDLYQQNRQRLWITVVLVLCILGGARLLKKSIPVSLSQQT